VNRGGGGKNGEQNRTRKGEKKEKEKQIDATSERESKPGDPQRAMARSLAPAKTLHLARAAQGFKGHANSVTKK